MNKILWNRWWWCKQLETVFCYELRTQKIHLMLQDSRRLKLITKTISKFTWDGTTVQRSPWEDVDSFMVQKSFSYRTIMISKVGTLWKESAPSILSRAIQNSIALALRITFADLTTKLAQEHSLLTEWLCNHLTNLTLDFLIYYPVLLIKSLEIFHFYLLTVLGFRYCKCEMPYNPDDLMVQCESCKDWYIHSFAFWKSQEI